MDVRVTKKHEMFFIGNVSYITHSHTETHLEKERRSFQRGFSKAVKDHPYTDIRPAWITVTE